LAGSLGAGTGSQESFAIRITSSGLPILNILQLRGIA
jgi:hypothetical protein